MVSNCKVHPFFQLQNSIVCISSNSYSEGNEVFERPCPKLMQIAVISKTYDSVSINYDDEIEEIESSPRYLSGINIKSESWLDKKRIKSGDAINNRVCDIYADIQYNQTPNDIKPSLENSMLNSSKSKLELIYQTLKEERKNRHQTRKNSRCCCI